MATLSMFFGIIVRMNREDGEKHHKPHVHVYYGEYEASVGLDGEVLDGSIPVNSIVCWLDGWLSMRKNCMKHGTKPSGIFSLTELSL